MRMPLFTSKVPLGVVHTPKTSEIFDKTPDEEKRDFKEY
jgi:hypothetical protein